MAEQEHEEHTKGGVYSVKELTGYTRDDRYITTRITKDGEDGFKVEPNRYRL